MDTNSIIHFIKQSRSLRLHRKNWVKQLLILPGILMIIFFSSYQDGIACQVASILLMILIIVANICYSFCMIKKENQKNNLFLSLMVYLNILFPLLFIYSTDFIIDFGSIYVLIYSLISLMASVFLTLLISSTMLKRKTVYKSDAPHAITGSFFGGFIFLLCRKFNAILNEMLSKEQHFLVIAVAILFANCMMLSIVTLDLQRYYYFKKLEKAGLVTEDILKPDDR